MDPIFSADGFGLNLFFTKYANIPHAKADQQKFEDVDTQVAPLEDVFPYQVCHVWSQLRYGGLERVCNTAGVRWDNADAWIESLPPSYRGWAYSDDQGNEVWSMEAGTVAVRLFLVLCVDLMLTSNDLKGFVKCLFAAKLPHRVCASQVAEWLPDLGCCPMMDIQANEYCLCPSLSTLLSVAAENLGEYSRICDICVLVSR